MISICIMYHEGDKHYLPMCLASLPKSEEVIVVKTEKIKDGSMYVSEVEQKGKIIRAKLFYKELDFARMRNEVMKLAMQEWILFLDADEVLLSHQIKGLMELLHYSHPKTGGYMMNIVSYSPHLQETVTVNHYVRLFRNRGFNYEYSIHEQVAHSIINEGYKIYDTDLIIHHLGYQGSKEEIVSKLKRNLAVLEYSQLHESGNEFIKERYTTYKENMLNLLESLYNGTA